MVVSKKPNSTKINIAIDGEQIEQVTSYVYLGSLITDDGRSEKEIKRRIMIARSIFTNMRTLLSCRGINLTTRLRAIKCYIWPTLFYGAETWTVTKSLLSRLDAFEMLVLLHELCDYPIRAQQTPTTTFTLYDYERETGSV